MITNEKMEKIIKENEGLIDQIISEVKFDRVRIIDDYEDLKQQGRIALFKAAQNYEAEKGEFVNYASVAIRRELKRYASYQDRFYIPEHQFHITNKIVRLLDKMTERYGTFSIDYIKRKFKCDKRKALQIIDMYKMAKSLTADEISSYSTPIPCFKSTQEDIEDFHKREHAESIIHTIEDIYGKKYAEIISAYFIDGKTLEEVANIFGVTRERVRQIIKKIDCSEPKKSMKDSENFRILKRALMM